VPEGSSNQAAAGRRQDDIRDPALCQVLRRDDGTYLFDHPALIESPNDAVRATAVQVLGKVESPAVEPLLRRAISDERDTIRRSALLIARKPADIEPLLVPYREIDNLCRLIADLKLGEARDGLARSRSVTPKPTSILMTGALAALGDKPTLAELHRLTAQGEIGDRAVAIEMCRYLDDEESAALVKAAANGEERRLQYAATKDLLRFQDRP